MTAADPPPDATSVAPPRCAVASLERGDPMLGTALPARRFLLVEDPGPWGPAAHPTGSMPVDAARHVEQLAHELGARLLLIRRPGRGALTDERRVALADLVTGEIRWGSAPSPEGLATIDPERVARVTREPAYLVCTHGRHDTCCAVEGRPLARELATRAPENTWECSHIGGDRFAANLLVLPSGLVYGRATPADVGELLDADLHGRMVPRLLRGRCGVAPAAQVAEAHVREAWDELRVGAIDVDDVDHLGHDRWQVRGRHRDDAARRFVAELRESHRPVSTGLTCAAPAPGRLRDWTLVSLELSA